MKNTKRKLELYEQVFCAFGPGESRCQVSQLASLWNVTERHVFTLVRTMEDSGWISWQANSGRSKKASLSCLIEPIDACYAEAQRLADDGQVDELLSLLSFGGRDAGKELQMVLNGTNHTAKQSAYIPFHRAIEPLHPHNVQRRTERFLVMHAYQRLTQVENNELKGDVAYHWTTNTEGTVWRFHVRSHVQFHDGYPLLAQDIVRSLQGLASHQCWSGCYQHVEAVRKVSDSVVEVKLNRPDRHLPRLLARAEASIFRKASPDKLVGSGAFSVDVFSTNMLRLNRNPLYSHQVPILDRVEIWFYPDWAVSKQCSHNQIRLQMPESTTEVGSHYPAIFMLLSNEIRMQDTRLIAVEDTSNAQELLGKVAKSGDTTFAIGYGEYSQTADAMLCSIIEENDRYAAWLSFLLRLPFEALNLSDETLFAIQSQLDSIRSEPDIKASWQLLSDLKAWLDERQILTELKREYFQLEVSERLQGSKVDGFGWCPLSELWVTQD
ncbi:ABC transporter substrate-binding protein [Vibrio tubiashii]|uniref:Peptide ABC transporter substrate-binding protein n=2 Tax=Vibrio tubiashii ATCC 19109 TaxID=1051646 RepID=A0A0A0SIR4_9VIBR|nr:ABC transporter substrate-binding protein [Vibrio tubiashii]AIW16908.1 peptide ABC transporter substrate-binding protein [Vibrio tubiashii ATCC 19109]